MANHTDNINLISGFHTLEQLCQKLEGDLAVANGNCLKQMTTIIELRDQSDRLLGFLKDFDGFLAQLCPEDLEKLKLFLSRWNTAGRVTNPPVHGDS